MIVKYYECSCGCNTMRIEYDEELDEFYISVYELHGNRMPMIHRIRHAIKILLSGDPYGDQMVFDEETVNKLVKDIKDIIGD